MRRLIWGFVVPHNTLLEIPSNGSNGTSFEQFVFWSPDAQIEVSLTFLTKLTSVTAFCGEVTWSKFQAWNQRRKIWRRNATALLNRCWLSLLLSYSVFFPCFFCALMCVLSSLAIIRERMMHHFVCLSGVLWLLCGSSSRCNGLVCSVRLWYFLIILTCFFKGQNHL